MNEKINWYKEVLDLEPGSRVFFPLAKLYASTEQFPEAVATLHQGLERHPDHFEAKLLLVECLAHLGSEDEVRTQVENLADTLGGFPVFWRTWASLLSSRSDAVDTAMAMNFLAAHFQGLPISWSEVIAEGLKAFLSNQGVDIILPRRPPEPIEPPLDEEVVFEAEEAVVPRKAACAGRLLSPDDVIEQEGDEDEEESGENFSLRTRTMAVLLTEQGDYKGALEIYEELLAAADSAEKRADIKRRIAELKERQTAEAKAGAGATDAKALGLAGALDGKNKLVHTLEALAQRLEQRAQR
jgi:tetratricopeptide (TPR) repeat protein